MTIFKATRASADFPVAGPGPGGSAKMAFGSIAVAVNPVALDTYEMCRLPDGAIVTGGYLYASDMDTDATETLDMNVGWAANGTETADPDGFGNLGVWLGDTSVHLPEGGVYFPLAGVLLTAGPKTFSGEIVIEVSCVVTAATFAAGQLTVVVFYNVG